MTEVDVEPEEEAPPETDAGRRLAEYRLFRAAMEALLLEPAETGERSFLGLVAPEVLPLERLRIPPTGWRRPSAMCSSASRTPGRSRWGW